MTPTCYQHPFRDAEATCVECRRSICSECRENVNGRPVCHSCVEAIRSRVAAELDAQSAAAITTAPFAPLQESAAGFPPVTAEATPASFSHTAPGYAPPPSAAKATSAPPLYVPQRAANAPVGLPGSAENVPPSAAPAPPIGNFDFSTPLPTPAFQPLPTSDGSAIPSGTAFTPVAVVPIRPANYLLGALFGIIGGLIGALIWDKIAFYTHLKIGYIAWGVGALVGVGIALGARGTNKITGIMAALLTFGAIMLGQYWILLDQLNEIHPEWLLPLIPTPRLFAFVAENTTVMSWVLTAIGVFISYGIASAPRAEPIRTSSRQPDGQPQR